MPFYDILYLFRSEYYITPKRIVMVCAVNWITLSFIAIISTTFKLLHWLVLTFGVSILGHLSITLTLFEFFIFITIV
jgi:hypothetical protein